MPFAVTHKVSNGSATDANTYTTASFSVAVGDLCFLVFTSAHATVPPAVPSSIAGTLGLTFTQRSTVTMNANNLVRTTILTAPCPTATGTLVVNLSTTDSSGQWTVFTMTGAENTNPVVREQSLQYSLPTTTMTLSPAPAADSAVVAAGHVNSGTAFTAGTGYTFIGNGTAQTTPTVIHGTEWDGTAPSATVGFTQTGTLNRGICAVEIRPAYEGDMFL